MRPRARVDHIIGGLATFWEQGVARLVRFVTVPDPHGGVENRVLSCCNIVVYIKQWNSHFR